MGRRIWLFCFVGFVGKEAALPRVTFFEPFLEQIPELLVADQSPTGARVESGWSLSGKAFDDQVGTQPFENVDEKVDVLFFVEEMEMFRMLCVLLGHRGIFEKLKLVEFDRVQWQGVDRIRLFEHHLSGLAG